MGFRIFRDVVPRGTFTPPPVFDYLRIDRQRAASLLGEQEADSSCVLLDKRQANVWSGIHVALFLNSRPEIVKGLSFKYPAASHTCAGFMHGDKDTCVSCHTPLFLSFSGGFLLLLLLAWSLANDHRRIVYYHPKINLSLTTPPPPPPPGVSQMVGGYVRRRSSLPSRPRSRSCAAAPGLSGGEYADQGLHGHVWAGTARSTVDADVDGDGDGGQQRLRRLSTQSHQRLCHRGGPEPGLCEPSHRTGGPRERRVPVLRGPEASFHPILLPE